MHLLSYQEKRKQYAADHVIVSKLLYQVKFRGTRLRFASKSA